MKTLDEELKSIALWVLRNEFYIDFSALVNEYLKSAEGLDIDEAERSFSDVANVYSRDEDMSREDPVNIWTVSDNGYSTGHDNILAALEFKSAVTVWVNGKVVFELDKDGEWILSKGENK